MEKSKLGVNVLLLAAAGWLLGYFGGLTVMVLYAGYILLMEENPWLKKQVLRVLAVMLTFSLINVVMGLYPNFLDLLNRIWQLFDSYVEGWSFLDKLVSLINELLYWCKMVIFVLFGLAAIKGKTFKLPLVDPFLDKYIV